MQIWKLMNLIAGLENDFLPRPVFFLSPAILSVTFQSGTQ